MLIHYLKIAFRNLWKYKTQSVVSVIGLAVGFTCFVVCSYSLRVGFSWNKKINDIENIYYVYSEQDGQPKGCGYRYAAENLKNNFTEIESGTTFYQLGPYIDKLCEITSGDNETIINYHKECFLFTDHSFLDAFGIRVLLGNKDEFINQPNAILLTEKTALKFFGTTDVIGKTFNHIDDFNDKQEIFTIQGVIENFPQQSQFERFSGIELNTEIINNPSQQWINDFFENYVKIDTKTDIKQLNQKLKNYSIPQLETSVQLIPLLDKDKLSGNNTAWIMSALLFTIGILVLLTTLVNYIGFVFGHILNRIKECGIRKVNGAISRNLFFSFFAETIVSFLPACLLSVVLVLFVSKYSSNVEFFYEIDTDFIIRLLIQYTIIGIVLLGLICFLSTSRLINMPIIQSLHGGFIKQKKSTVRNIFLTVQLFICFLLLGGSWFIYSQSNYLEKQYSLGLSEDDKSRIFQVSLNGDKLEPVRNQIIDELEQNPNIEMISRNGMSLLGPWGIGEKRFSWSDITSEQEKAKMSHMYTDANYLDFIRIKIKEGRFFDIKEPDKAVVNESFIKVFGRNPIGEQISVNCWGVMKDYTIVGILPDLINSQFRSDEVIHPCIYMPYPDGYANLTCYVKVRKGYEETFREEITESLHRFVHKATPVYVENLKEDRKHTINNEVRIFTLIFIFSIICVVTSLLGMYALIVINTEKRRKEIAIRKINGAGITDIIWIFCKSNLVLVIVSAIIAMPLLYYGLNLWLQNYALRINISILHFIWLVLLMLALVSLTILGQIIRISKLNPAEIIKSE